MSAGGGNAKLAVLPAAGRALVEAAAAGKPKSVYLVYGEPYLVNAVAPALVDALVPAARRSFNLEIYDGRTTSVAAVLDTARTPGLFAGAKVIWVREPPMLAPGERRADALQAIAEAVRSGRMESASARFLAMIAAAGWSQEEFEQQRISEMPKRRVADAFGAGADAETIAALDELQAWVRERGMPLAAAADASAELIAMIEKGLPAGIILLFTASSVDSRKRVVKRLREVGAVVELTLERERSGALKVESAGDIVNQILRSYDKRIEPAARRRLLQMAGSDAGTLANEVEKLCLYVGDAATIGAADVIAAVRDLGDAWIFDLTDALANREARRALIVLRGLLEGGDHPLRLLATLHSHIRLLLALRDCLDGPWRGLWKPDTRVDAFPRLIDRLSEAEKAMLGGIHPFRLSLNAGHAARMESRRLREALHELADLDARFKSSRGDPAILLERFVMQLCRPHG